MEALAWIFLIPTVAGSVYALLCVAAMIRFRQPPARAPLADAAFPPATILKPIYGMEKNLRENLHSTCLQDYPEYQVVFSVQRPDDAALPLLREVQREFGEERVTVAVENRRAGSNGKINNLLGALPYARHEVLVISDSDVRLRPDYLKKIVAPLSDPNVGCVCTLYKAACAERWFEKLELLSLNADFITNVVFAHVSGASNFCLGASAALRRSTLDAIGGLASLADYLVEDYEMGRRIWESGRRIKVVPEVVDTMVDLEGVSQWWTHQVYWDQNTRAARPFAFFATALIRSVPFALLYAVMLMGAARGWLVFAGALLIRMAASAFVLGWGLRDREGLRSLWLLPFRDVAALFSWLLAFTQSTTTWRGAEFTLTRDGRLLPRR
jgi:ceramide glucosyltransferase